MRFKKPKRASMLIWVICVLFVFTPFELLFARTIDIPVQESIQYFLDNNRDYKKFEADWQNAKYNVMEAASAAYPSIALTGNYTHLGEIQSFVFDLDGDGPEEPLNMKTAAEANYTGALEIQQQLFSGSVFGAIGVAKKYRKAANHNFNAQKSRLIRDYLTAYAQLQMLADVLDLNREMIELTKTHFEETKLLYEIGAVDNYSLLRSEVEHLNSIPALKEAQKNYDAAYSNLKLLLNLQKDDDLVVHLFDIDCEFVDNIETVLLKADENREEISSASNVTSAYKKAVNVYRSGYLPTVSAFFNYNRQNQWDMFSQNEDWINSWNTGISVHIPLFSGFRTHSQVQKGKLDLLKARQDESILRDQIKIETRLAYDDYVRSSSDFDAWYRNVKLAEEGLEIAQLRWSNGDGSELELRDARVALKLAKVNLSNARYDLLRAKVQLLYAIGEIDSINIVEREADNE